MTEEKLTLNLTTTIGSTSTATQSDRPKTLPKFPPLMASARNSSDVDQVRFFSALAEQVGLWSFYNFDKQASHRPGMGMAEEILELNDALAEFDREKALDAIGDCTIYMADYFFNRGWDLGSTWAYRRPLGNSPVNIMGIRLAGRLLHNHLKGEQNIRGGAAKQAILMREACEHTLWFLLSVSQYLGSDYLVAISNVWATVSQRDWVERPNTAHQLSDEVVSAQNRALAASGDDPNMAAAHYHSTLRAGYPKGEEPVLATSDPSGPSGINYEVGDDLDTE
jgi:NTP pyrophosphatase (non-canonical NTP hydrolase)